MTGRILRMILGVVIFICSTPLGMAKQDIPEEVRACFFAGDELSADDGQGVQEAALFFCDEAALFDAEGSEVSESETEEESETNRYHKRSSGKKFFLSKCRIATGLSAELLSKGVARHPLTQDARQQRTALIRFVLLSALIS